MQGIKTHKFPSLSVTLAKHRMLVIFRSILLRFLVDSACWDSEDLILGKPGCVSLFVRMQGTYAGPCTPQVLGDLRFILG